MKIDGFFIIIMDINQLNEIYWHSKIYKKKLKIKTETETKLKQTNEKKWNAKKCGESTLQPIPMRC